jgi:UDP-N-acetylmuramoyl-tripeptide--D-alanyl-D-alanine ligase
MLDYPIGLLARVLDARLEGSGDEVVRRVCTDSRKIEPGDLFVAIPGENFDGHRFVKDSLAKGAVAALANREQLPPDAASAGPLIAVSDPLKSLGDLGAWHRDRFNVRMVAVTGSVGKTTTKDLVAGVLSQQWTTLKSPGNLNNEIGLPLALLDLRAEHQAAVVELAMRGPGQIRYLARIARPEVAIITNIGLSHIELLGSQEAIAHAKAEVLDFLPESGTAVLNADDSFFPVLRDLVPPRTQVLSYGLERPERDSVSGHYLGPAGVEDREKEPVMGARFSLRLAREKSVQRAFIPLLGRHNVCNALGAAAVGQALGISPLRIRRGLAEAEISGMRMTAHDLPGGGTLLDDAYNASTPEAMESALEVLVEMPGLRKVAVLGSMLELGPASEAAHERVGKAVAQAKPNVLVTVGEGGAKIAASALNAGLPSDRVTQCTTNEEAVAAVLPLRRPGDIVLVKGSRGVAMEHVVAALRKRMKAEG